jgi:acetylornithine deacetylase/succinyl-diaminopimelate desuccinylase-like protein
MNIVNLTKKLISIPSYVGSDSNEKEIGEFIARYLSKIKWLKIKKQKITKDRFNIIVTDGKPIKLLLIGHLDTVQPQKEWKTNPFKGPTKNGKIFGLGASDMKGSLACMIRAIEKSKPTSGLTVLFYIDEEYDFLGMKKFIKEYKNKIKPSLIISGDGGNLRFNNGCRGLIEITFKVRGQSAHAANPEAGKNAIEGAFEAIKEFKKALSQYSTPDLGISSCNLAFLRGGLNRGGNEGDKIRLGREGNIVPDFAEFVLDIRPASPNLKSKTVIKVIEDSLKRNGYQLLEAKVRHDLGAWITPKKDIKKIVSLFGKPKFTDISKAGYGDTQMLWEAFNKIPCVAFGPGEINCAHKANEYVRISSLIKAEKFFRKLIQSVA